MTKLKSRLLIISLVLISLLALGYYLSLKQPQRPQEITSQGTEESNDGRVRDLNNEEKDLDVATSFEELTIPYLRSREYISEISELKLLSEEASYKSYLTSYLSDGLKVNGLLTIPNGDKPDKGWPAVVFVHGYIPPESYKTTSNYSAYVDYLAKNGFVVFKIDLRGHADSEGEPGGAYYSSDYVIDTLNAYTALQSSDFVDKDNIGLWGHSMGGNVVFRAFVAKKDIKAVSIWAGAVYTYNDFMDYSISDNSYRPPSQDSESRRKRNELFETYGEFDPQNEFWMKIVPTNYLGGLSGAVQINHAVDDDVVSVEYTRNLSGILLDTNIKSEINEYQSGGHNISGASFSAAMQDTVDFYNTFLKE